MGSNCFVAATLLIIPTAVGAAPVTVTGRVIQSQGHQNPACRMVTFRKTDGTTLNFRMPASAAGVEDAIAATALTALATGYPAQVNYDPAVTSGCGAEPVTTWIGVSAP